MRRLDRLRRLMRLLARRTFFRPPSAPPSTTPAPAPPPAPSPPPRLSASPVPPVPPAPGAVAGAGTPAPSRDPGDDWTSPATILAVTALVISLFALYFAWSSAKSAERQAESSERQAEVAGNESERRPLLEVASARPYVAEDITGRERSPGSPDVAVKGLRGPRIDLVLRNRGNGEAMIADVTVKIQRSERLRSCYPLGGPLKVAFDYEIGFPEGTQAPFTVTRPMNFVIPSGRHDRFTLGIGPHVTGEGSAPWIGVVSVVLHQKDGRDLEQGPFAVVDAGGLKGLFELTGPAIWTIVKPDDPACMRGNHRSVADVVATPGLVVSRELTALKQALKPYE
ncbi:hypothetical protein ACLQ2R_30715 [Streptosporangium sp. DT93]|uniref:hypothetical protein n=1 Tax=Streptosporangium sp. DT93 TaxID=3393428 RepID=UPI003CE76DF3